MLDVAFHQKSLLLALSVLSRCFMFFRVMHVDRAFRACPEDDLRINTKHHEVSKSQQDLCTNNQNSPFVERVLYLLA
jgi:hypothetical protein